MENDFEVGLDVKVNNSYILNNLDIKLNHLEASKCKDLQQVLLSFSDLCSDTPKTTSLVTHDITLLENTQPIKQHPYRLPPY